MTEQLTGNSLILLLFHRLTEVQQEHVASALTSALTNSAPAMSVP
jgi:hypothetical protein